MHSDDALQIERFRVPVDEVISLTLCAVEALCEKCIPSQRRLLQKLEAPVAKYVPDVKDRREKHRNQKGKHVHQVSQDGVFANRENSQNRTRCFSYQLPSSAHAATAPPASQVPSHSSKIKEAYENKTRRFDNERSKIQSQAQHLPLAPLACLQARRASRYP